MVCKQDLENIKIGHPLRLIGMDGLPILINRAIIGHVLGWELWHGETVIITKEADKITNYVQNHQFNQGDIIDLGEF